MEFYCENCEKEYDEEFYCEDCGKRYEEERGNLIEINGVDYCEKCAKKYLENYFKKN